MKEDGLPRPVLNPGSTAPTIETQVKLMTRGEVKQTWDKLSREAKIVLVRLCMDMSIPLTPGDFESRFQNILIQCEMNPKQSLSVDLVYKELHQSGLIIEGVVIPATPDTKYITGHKEERGYFINGAYRPQLKPLAEKLY